MTKFFIVEQNQLNTDYIVYSKDERLPHCWAFTNKKQAEECAEYYNKIANEQVKVLNYV